MADADANVPGGKHALFSTKLTVTVFSVSRNAKANAMDWRFVDRDAHPSYDILAPLNSFCFLFYAGYFMGRPTNAAEQQPQVATGRESKHANTQTPGGTYVPR